MEEASMGPLALKREERFTYGDYLTWDDGERWELIDGVPYNMSPAPTVRHQAISRELLTEFALHLRGKPCQVFAAPFDVRLPEADESDDLVETVVQPDLSVVCDKKKLDDAGCRGAPELTGNNQAGANHDLPYMCDLLCNNSGGFFYKVGKNICIQKIAGCSHIKISGRYRSRGDLQCPEIHHREAVRWQAVPEVMASLPVL
jgi:Putative restriction endonuclease